MAIGAARRVGPARSRPNKKHTSTRPRKKVRLLDRTRGYMQTIPHHPLNTAIAIQLVQDLGDSGVFAASGFHRGRTFVCCPVVAEV